jgi:hypothetical protein
MWSLILPRGNIILLQVGIKGKAQDRILQIIQAERQVKDDARIYVAYAHIRLFYLTAAAGD